MKKPEEEKPPPPEPQEYLDKLANIQPCWRGKLRQSFMKSEPDHAKAYGTIQGLIDSGSIILDERGKVMLP